MKRIIEGLVSGRLVSTSLNQPIHLTVQMPLTERSRRQQGMMALKEMLE